MNYQQILGAQSPVLRLDYADGDAAFAKVERLSSGAARVPANITRTGVLSYSLPDGSKRREYRPPEEVFAPESLASLKSAPLTVGHPRSQRVDLDSHREVSVGHTEDVAPRENFVSGNVVVTDADVIARVVGKELCELSPGYVCEIDPSPGVSPDGEPYDVVQRGIRYNHVALLPKGKGRSGPDVGVRIDSARTREPLFTPEELANIWALVEVAARKESAAQQVPDPELSPAIEEPDDPEREAFFAKSSIAQRIEDFQRGRPRPEDEPPIGEGEHSADHDRLARNIRNSGRVAAGERGRK